MEVGRAPEGLTEIPVRGRFKVKAEFPLTCVEMMAGAEHGDGAGAGLVLRAPVSFLAPGTPVGSPAHPHRHLGWDFPDIAWPPEIRKGDRES